MKKIFAISLLFVHLFNIAGYNLLLNFFIHQSNVIAVQQLDDNQYNDKDLAEVKIPLHLPYMTSTSGFVRTDGDVEFNGIHYNYVKRKISNDTLYILCKPNYTKTKLANEKNNYASAVNDASSNKKLPSPLLKKSGYPGDYFSTCLNFCTHKYFSEVSRPACTRSSKLPTVLALPAGKPPEQHC